MQLLMLNYNDRSEHASGGIYQKNELSYLKEPRAKSTEDSRIRYICITLRHAIAGNTPLCRGW